MVLTHAGGKKIDWRVLLQLCSVCMTRTRTATLTRWLMIRTRALVVTIDCNDNDDKISKLKYCFIVSRCGFFGLEKKQTLSLERYLKANPCPLGCTKISKRFRFLFSLDIVNYFLGVCLSWPPFCRKCPFYTLKTSSKCSKFKICLLQGWAGIPVSRDSREYKPQISSKINVKKVILWKSTFLSTWVDALF